VKSRTMLGYDSPYVPGWDCHGLPIEHEVRKELGPKRHQMSAADFRRACREFAAKFVDLQRQDFIRLGVLGDWFHPYETMAFDYEATIAESLGRFMETGRVYKGLKPILWCWYDQSALAEAEVEYSDHTSPSIYVRFRLTDDSVRSLDLPVEKPAYAVIWTTTPWTLPANLAIAVKPDFEYSIVEHDGTNSIIASELVNEVARKFGWNDYRVVKVFKGSAFEYLKYRHAWLPREGVFVLGEYVTLDAGTGLVHTAPGHGADDFNTGKRYNLDIYTPVNGRGEFADDVPEFAGVQIFKANPQIIELLRERGALLLAETLTHSYPHCWRCKNPVIFRATEQWFIAMDGEQQTASGEEAGASSPARRAPLAASLRQRALDEIHKVKWFPPWGEDRLAGMIENRPDWCISRQRLWGVPITVLYCEKCGEPVTSKEFFARVVEVFRNEGADAWFERPVGDFLTPDFACACGNRTFRKETDILDVWFDSGCSSIAVLKTRSELTWPAAVYLEGHDQHRGWFQSSLLVGTGIEGAAPYKQVVTCGFIVNESGEKMSKSRGTGVSPQEVIRDSGADILRLWVSMVDYRDDVVYGKGILGRAAESYKKIRNSGLRYLLSNLYDFDPDRDAVPIAEMRDIDSWALTRAAEVVDRCRQAYEEYEFHVVYHRVLDFVSVELSAIYVDVSKDTMYCEAPKSIERRSAQTAMFHILCGLVGVLAPILSFTADETYEAMPGAKEASVHLTDMPRLPEAGVDAAAWDRLFVLREMVSKVLERARAAQQIGQSLEADIQLHGDFSPKALTGDLEIDLAKFFIVSHVDFRPPSDEAGDVVDIPGLGTIEVTMSPARGKKCGRCWQYREEVANDGGLCARCENVIEGLAPAEAATI
ncbi:MAG TPA: isoleucine--tRNA ligase, partial [Thermoanaerobaculia bacterium]|nr:isoleucine--tRNA ligase [Thermoanaerobaculia bacterium]